MRRRQQEFVGTIPVKPPIKLDEVHEIATIQLAERESLAKTLKLRPQLDNIARDRQILLWMSVLVKGQEVLGTELVQSATVQEPRRYGPVPVAYEGNARQTRHQRKVRYYAAHSIASYPGNLPLIVLDWCSRIRKVASDLPLEIWTQRSSLKEALLYSEGGLRRTLHPVWIPPVIGSDPYLIANVHDERFFVICAWDESRLIP